MDRQMLEFLFVGPLFSIFKAINGLRKEIMSLKDQLTDYGSRIDSITAELRSDIERLQNALSQAEQVDPEIQAAADSLGDKISALEALDVPNPVETPPIDTGTAGGTSILTPPEPVPDETTVASPGEPITELPSESPVPEEGSPGEPQD